MQAIDVIRQAQGGRAIDNLAAHFGIAPSQAEAAIAAVLPELSRHIERNTLSRGGLADIVAALGDGHHARSLDDPRALADPAMRDDGNAILGHILGSRDQSRAVAANAAMSSGLGEGLIRMLLPYIASWLMGSLAKSAGGGLGDILGRMGGAPAGQPPSRRDSGIDMPRLPETPSVPGGGLSMPDSGGPGAPDAGGMGLPMPPDTTGGSGRWGSRTGSGGNASPLPLPGEPMPDNPGRGDNPYGDLSDILRKGRGADLPGAGAAGGGALWSMVRNILGGALGFRSGGILSWLFRMIVLRFGWGLVRRLLGRMLLGR